MRNLFTPTVLVCVAITCASNLVPAAAAAREVTAFPQDVAPALAPASSTEAVIADSLDAYMSSAVEAGFSGVVLVAKGGEILVHGAYSPDPTVTRESAFWIGSVSKPVTAAAIMRLQEQGRLRVGDPIWRHLPDVPADKRHITIHHLLSHTSGLGTEYAADGVIDRHDATRAILALPLEHEPGTAGYSNDGYTLLAVLVATVAGRSFEEYVAEEVLAPAGMAGAGFWGVPARAGQATLAPVRRPPAGSAVGASWGYRGATGISARAEDLFRWQRALQTGNYLTDFSRQVMFAPHVQWSDREGYGYGWMVLTTDRGTRLLQHNGAESGIEHYAGVRRYAEEDYVVVILSNADEQLTWETESELVGVLWRVARPD